MLEIIEIDMQFISIFKLKSDVKIVIQNLKDDKKWLLSRGVIASFSASLLSLMFI